MAAPQLSTNFRSIVAPILNKEFDGIYDQRTDEWKQIFKEINGVPRSYHEEPVLYGFGVAPLVPEGSPTPYDIGGQTYVQRYVYYVYGLAFAITKILAEDGDHIRIGQIFAKHLAQSLIETDETNAANILNRAFNSSYVGGDGVSLISASHPTAGAGTYSNQLAVNSALSQTSLEQLLIQIVQAIDDRGKKINLVPEKLVVSANNTLQAEVLLKSVLRAGGANNDINPIITAKLLKGGQALFTRVTSTTAWWISTNAPAGTQLVMRRKLEKSMEGDFETDSMRYKATERMAWGWTNPRTLFGTAGA